MEEMSKDMLEERKGHYKALLPLTMPLQEKIDELCNLREPDLGVLLEQFKEDEDYEICQAIKAVLDKKRFEASKAP